jgi:hypothetical protein
MIHGLRSALLALSVPFALAACNGGAAPPEDAGGGDKAAFEKAATELKQPVALLAAYQPFLHPAEVKDVYAPKRRPEMERASTAAAGEIRFAANSARQKIPSSPAAMKDVEAALSEISKACTDAADSAGFDQCGAAVTGVDAALVKAAAAATTAGATGKIPRVAPESITDEAKKAIASFLKVLGPSPAEEAYAKKRGDAAASLADVTAACQAAATEVSDISTQYQASTESIRIIAVSHKMSLDSQCKQLDATENLRKDLGDCKKKPKSTECKVVCSKVRARIEEGLPAAVFAKMNDDVAAICEK